MKSAVMRGSPPVRPPSMFLTRALRLRVKTGTWCCEPRTATLTPRKARRTLSGRLFRTAYMIVRNRHDSEDIVQETLVQAWRSLHLLRDPDAFRGWLMRICTNKATSIIRQLQRRATDPYDSEVLRARASYLTQRRQRPVIRRSPVR